jgi:hypothetical protein
MKWGIVMLVVGCIAVAGFVGPLRAAEDVSIFCYVGNPQDNEYIGTVDVFDIRTAANSCNVMYNSCGGNCTGCFDDSESREVCVDPFGRIYYE